MYIARYLLRMFNRAESFRRQHVHTSVVMQIDIFGTNRGDL